MCLQLITFSYFGVHYHMSKISNTVLNIFFDCRWPHLLLFLIITRKSSCVNARGISTSAYQVLHLLPEVGYPPAGVPSWPGMMRGYLRWGTTPLAGVPQPGLTGGTQSGVPPAGVTLPGRGTPPARSDGRGYPR